MARPLPDSARRVLIAHNPTAGSRLRRRLVEDVIDELDSLNYQAEAVHDLDELQAEAAEAHRDGTLRTVVAAGGDGTAAEVVNRTPPGVPLTVLPLGTENLLSRYLGQRKGPAAVTKLIERGVTVQLDAGRANGRLFLLMCGAGPDAQIVADLHARRNGHITHLSYAKPVLRTLRSYRYPRIRVSFPSANGDLLGSAEPITGRWIEVVNLPLYGLGLRFAPQGSGTDGLLDVCAFRRGGLAHNLWFLSQVALGRHRNMRDCTLTQCSTVHLESDEPVAYQLDGDPAGVLPVTLDLLPGRLTMVVSRQSARRLGFACDEPES